jgi:hypothetical protein
MVGKAGLEPARLFQSLRILSPMRIPIPPLPHRVPCTLFSLSWQASTLFSRRSILYDIQARRVTLAMREEGTLQRGIEHAEDTGGLLPFQPSKGELFSSDGEVRKRFERWL